MACLYAPGSTKELLPPLRHAKVLAMNEQGMCIEGRVTIAEREALKSKSNTFVVRWIVKQIGAPAVLNTQKLKERSRRRLALVQMSGFDPQDD